jgi:hypothetical protein
LIGSAQQIINWLFKYASDATKQFEIKEHKKKRSLNANSFYWKMVGEISKATRVSTARIHNTNLRHMGLMEKIEDRLVTVVLPDTDAAEEQIIESTTYHLFPTSQTRTGRDGVAYRTYAMLRGSHTFNTAEFSALIDLVIQDAEAQGIDTITPDEKRKMMELYGKAYEKKHNPTGTE